MFFAFLFFRTCIEKRQMASQIWIQAISFQIRQVFQIPVHQQQKNIFIFLSKGYIPYTILAYVLGIAIIYIPMGQVLRNDYFSEHSNTLENSTYWKIICFSLMLGPFGYIGVMLVYYNVSIKNYSNTVRKLSNIGSNHVQVYCD